METNVILLDPNIDAALKRLKSPTTIVIHGGPGTGKSLLGGHMVHYYLSQGKTINAVMLGDESQVSQFLNQTMGTGLDLYSYQQLGKLVLYEANCTIFAELARLVCSLPPADVALVDQLDYLHSGPLEDQERLLAWLLRRRNQSAIITAKSLAPARNPFVDVAVDLLRAGRDVERGYADATLELSVRGSSFIRNLHVGTDGTSIWEP